jgi:hypothetical protein
MKEEDHFTQTLLSLLSHIGAQGSMAAAFGSPSFSLSLSCSLLILKLCCSLLVSIYRQEWCHQL